MTQGGSSSTNASSKPAIMGVSRDLLKGQNFDNIYIKKNEEISNLKKENNELIKENQQFKKLNEQLVQRVDMLTRLIEREADGGDYYSNFPPKMEELPTIVSKFDGKGSSSGAGDGAGKSESEVAKVTRTFKTRMKRQQDEFDRQMKDLKLTYQKEIEEMTTMFSKSSRELMEVTFLYRNKVAEFNSY